MKTVMTHRETHKGRRLLTVCNLFVAVLAKMLFTLPAFLCCCEGLGTDEQMNSPVTETVSTTQITLKSSSNSRCLDIFFFNNDELKRLDSYQRIEGSNLGSVQATSTTGEKLLAVVANSPSDIYTWSDVDSYESLKSVMFDLCDEDPSYPIMSGECSLDDSQWHSCELSLEPLMAKVSIKSLCCDFSGRPYEGCKLENVRIYLTNVNGSCPAIIEDSVTTETLINLGGLNETELSDFAVEDLLLKELDDPVGTSSVSGIDLYCYPNTNSEDLPGSPFTRLVIEGEIDGNLYYYPLNINRDEDGNGVERNKTYAMYITLTRKGSTDPDTPIEGGSAIIEFYAGEWEEKSEISIDY